MEKEGIIMSEEKKLNEKELNEEELNNVAGGEGGAILEPSKAACPVCGQHALAISKVKKTTFCANCLHTDPHLCPECGSTAVHWSIGIGGIVACHKCGFDPEYNKV